MIRAINIKLLKGTHTILTGDQTYYSPVWGLVFAEKSVCQNLYDLSQRALMLHVKNELANVKDEAKKALIVAYTKGLKNTATEQLASVIFNRVDGDFRLTAAPNNLGTYLTPEIIGNILRLIYEDSKKESASGGRAESNQLDKKALEAVIKQAIQAKNINIKDVAKKYKKAQGDSTVQSLEDQIKKYVRSLKIIKKDSASFLDWEDVRVFVKALVASLKECDVNNPQAIYPKNTPQNMLLGYLLKKAQTKEDLQKYFQAFLGRAVSLSNEEYADFEMVELVKTAPDLSDTIGFANYLCAAVYQQEYVSQLPKIAAVSDASITFNGTHFPDCCELMLRNVCNIVTYDYDKKQLGVERQGIIFSQALKAFYTNKRKNPGDLELHEIRQTWSDLVQNHDAVLYNRVASLNNQNYLKCPDKYTGFMPVDKVDASWPKTTLMVDNQSCEFVEKKVGDQTYLLVPRSTNLVCYEIWPTVSNIVVLLNDFFQLGLTASISDILQEGFAKKVFPELCEKLGWDIHEVTLSAIQNLESGKIKNIQLDIVQNGSQFSINLIAKAHGYVSVCVKNRSMQLPKINAELYQQYPVQTAATVGISCSTGELQKIDDKIHNGLQLVSYASVKSSENICSLIEWLLELNNQKSEFYIKKLFISLSLDPRNLYAPNHLLDFMLARLKKINITPDLMQAFDVMNDTLILKIQDTNRELFESVKDVSNKLMLLKHFTKQSSEKIVLTPRIFLVMNAMGNNSNLDRDVLAEIVSLMEEGVHDHNHQDGIMSLMKELLENNKIDAMMYSRVFSLIEIGINNVYVQHSAMQLILKLLRKGTLDVTLLSRVLPLVEIGLKSDHGDTQMYAMGSVFELIIKGTLNVAFLSRIILLIEMGLDSDCDLVKIIAMKSLLTLIEKGMINATMLPRVMLLLEKGLKRSSNGEEQSMAMQSILVLIEKGMINATMLSHVVSLIEWGLRRGVDDTPMYAMQAINALISKNILTIEQAETLLRVFNKFDIRRAGSLKKDLEKYIENKKQFVQVPGSMHDTVTSGSLKMMITEPGQDNALTLPMLQQNNSQAVPVAKIVGPSHETLAAQRAAMEEFNRNLAAQNQTDYTVPIGVPVANITSALPKNSQMSIEAVRVLVPKNMPKLLRIAR